MKGKKPTAAQRNALKRKVKDDYINYLYLKEEVIDDNGNRLGRDTVKETFYVFMHKDTKDVIKVPATKRH